MNPKRIPYLLFSLILVFAMSMGVAAQDDEDSDVSLTLAGWSSSDAEDAALQARLTEFTEQTGIEVDFVPSSDHRVTMQTAFASGDYAEVFYIDSSYLSDWVEAGVVDIGEDFIEDQEGFYGSLLDVFTYDGILYCPPKDFSTMALQYNKDLFDAAGLDYPTADWTWDDLRSAAEALTDEEAGVIGLVTPPNLERFMPFMYQNGGAIFDESGEYVFDSEATTEAIDYYISFAQDGIGGPPSAVDAGWGGEAFGIGRASMAMEGNWMIQFMLDNYPEVNWGVVELPTGSEGDRATMAFTVCYGVGYDNDHQEESWQLVNFLTNTDGANSVAEASFGPMPSREAAAETYLQSWAERTAGANVDAADFEAFFAGAEYSYPWLLPIGWGRFSETFNASLERGFSGELTAEDVLFEANQIAEELLEE